MNVLANRIDATSFCSARLSRSLYQKAPIEHFFILSVSGQEVDAESGRRILLCFAQFDGSALSEALELHAGSDVPVKINAILKGVQTSTLGSSLVVAARKQAQTAIDECKGLLNPYGLLAAGVGLNFDNEGSLQPFLEHKWQTDIPKALGTLKALPGQHQLRAELGFVHAFVEQAKAVAIVQKDRLSNPERGQRKITDERAKQFVAMRCQLNEFHGLHSSESMKDIFSTVQETGAQMSLGTLDLSRLPDTIKSFEGVCQDVCNAWKTDIDDLAKLVESYIPSGWELHKEEILQENKKDILKALMDNPGKVKMAKGAALMNQWRKIVKTVNLNIIFDYLGLLRRVLIHEFTAKVRLTW